MGSGRQRLKGQGQKSIKNVRHSETARKKNDVVQMVNRSGMQAALSHFYSHLSPTHRESKRKQIYAWIKNSKVIESLCAATTTSTKTKARKQGIETILGADVEQELVEWVNALRLDGIPVTSIMLRLKALEFAKSHRIDGFKASTTWVVLYKKRQKLALRARTRHGQIPPEKAAEIAGDFG